MTQSNRVVTRDSLLAKTLLAIVVQKTVLPQPVLEVGWHGTPALPWPPGKHTTTSFLRQLENKILNA